MIHDDGIPVHADPHERTIVYGAPLRPFVRGAAMVTERQLAAAQGVGTLSNCVFQYHPDELSFASEAPGP